MVGNLCTFEGFEQSCRKPDCQCEVSNIEGMMYRSFQWWEMTWAFGSSLQGSRWLWVA